MLTTTSKALIDEAENLVASIRSGVIVHVQDGLLPTHLRAMLSATRSLQVRAARIGDKTLCEASDALEAWHTLLAAESDPVSHTRTRSLLDQISDVEVALISYKAASGSASLDDADFVDETFHNLGLAQTERHASEGNGNVEFDTDTELLDVFRDESATLLQNIRRNLDVLLARPNDRDALWEIKRSAHTFKGAAGILGLKRSSELAHRIEDLLDRLSRQDADANVEILDLVQTAAKCLKRLSDGEESEQLDARMLLLHRQFNDVLRDILKSEDEPVIEASASADVPSIPDSENCVQPVAAPDSQSRNRSIIRVSVERLDDLVKQVHDLVASYPGFERQMDAFNQQIEESCNNTHRLQAASGRIQHFEAPPLESTSGAIWEHVRRLEFRQNTYELSETVKDAEAIDSAMDNVRSELGSLFVRQENLIAEIQRRLMRLRKVEFGTVANRLQRTVRVTCDEEGKNAEVVIENASLEVDTQIIDSLIEPLMHLLKNAVVHGIEPDETRRMLTKPETGRITIRVDSDDTQVILSVMDDGGGIFFASLLEKAVASGLISQKEADEMAPDDLHHLIFLPGLTTAEKLSLNAGRGVGMSIIRESVAAINGTISIETFPQKGTTFKLCVPHPFAQVAVVPEEAAEPEPVVLSGEFSALIVDDSPSVRAMTSRILKDAGWHAETAKNGLEALDRLRTAEVRPDVILSDLEMPKMGGHAFIAEVRADDSLKDIPVVFITSKTDSSNMDKALEMGAAEYITKPYRERDLIDLLNRLVLSSGQSETN